MIKKYLSVLTAVSLSLVAVTGTYSNAAEKEVTEVTTKRSEYRKVFNNGDGTYTAYTNTAPIHFLDNGEWTEIDNTLVDNGDGFYKNKNNSFSVSLPSELNIADAESSAVNLSYEKLNISCALTNIEIPSGFESQPAYIDVNNAVYDSAYDMNIPEGLAAAFSNASAEADYRSISDGLDLNMSVHNSTFTESLVINDVDKIPESVTYSVSAEDVQLERAEDNSLLFLRDGEVVLEIPMFVMSDSAEELNEYIINYDVFETENGYDIVLYPLSSVGDVGSVVMPVNNNLIWTFDRNDVTRTSYISQSYPNNKHLDTSLRVGNQSNDTYQTFVTVLDDFTMYSEYATIISANFDMYINTRPTTSGFYLDVYSNNRAVGNISWNNSSAINRYNTHISATCLDGYSNGDWVSLDVTSLTQAWLNYVNSDGIIGIENNGFKIATNNIGIFTSKSERNSANMPYYTVKFSINIASNTLDYSPYKYNNISSSISGTGATGKIYNFQYSMNCYAYALQVYCRNNNYKLYPGEFGLNYNPISHLCDNLKLVQYKSTNMHNELYRQNFIEARMFEDATALGFEISPCFTATSTSSGPKFVLPLTFNESNERIIAMTTKLKTYDSPNNCICDFHFFLRHGNGSCPNHSGTCSMWSHKPGTEEVVNSFHDNATNSDIILCDENIAQNIACNGYSSNARYYAISKNTDIYNSWHDANTSNGATSYRP